MRIDRLDLTAFGCFTDRRLDLSAPGVHLVSGPNEAGKSTARYAVGQLLYGIDHRSTFDFVHAMSEMRLGGLLRDARGRALEIVRHKRLKNALCAPDGTPIPDAELVRVLADIAADEFAAVFAMDHDELRAGGQDLLDGKGDVGRALFESRSSSRLADVQNTLIEKSGELWRPNSKRKINSALKRLGELRREVREHELAPRDFAVAEKAVARAEEEYGRLEGDLREARARQARLGQVRAALPQLLLRSELRAERDRLAAAGPVVGDDVVDELERLTQRLRQARTDTEHDRAALREAEAELAALEVDTVHLEHADAIEELHADVSAVREASVQLARADEELWELRRKAQELLDRVRPGRLLDDPEAYALGPGVAERIAGLRRELTVRDTALAAAREQVERREAKWTDARAALDAMPSAGDAEALRALLRAVPEALVADISRHERSLAETTAKAAAVRARHGLAAVGDEDAARLPRPARDLITEHRARTDKLRAESEAVAGRREDTAERLKTAEADLEVLLRGDPPPTDEELRAARAERDALWALVRAGGAGVGAGALGATVGGATVDGATADSGIAAAATADVGTADAATVGAAPADETADAFERAVARADDLADRIRRQASESVRRLQLEVGVRQDRALMVSLTDEQAVLVERGKQAAADWAGLWTEWTALGVAVPEAAAAGQLLDGIAELTELAGESADAERALRALRTQEAELVARFHDELAKSGESTAATALRELTGLADLRVTAVEDALRAREQAQAGEQSAAADRDDARTDLARAEKARAEWETVWADVVRDLDLDGYDPESLAAAVDTLAEVGRKASAVAEATRRRDESAARVTDFDGRLTTLLATAWQSEPAAGDARFTQVAEHHAALSRARAARDARELHAGQAERLGRRIENGEAVALAAERELAALVEAAGVADEKALRDAVARTLALRTTGDELAAVEGLLRDSGMPVAELERLAGDWSPADLDAELLQLATDVERAQAAYDTAGTELGRVRQVLAAIDDSARAAQAQEAASAQVAELAVDVEQYVRLELARVVLQRCIEEYRRDNQDPVLMRAQDLFAALTGGRFAELVTETEPKKGSPVLKARRAGAGPDAEPVPVEAMSEGTRDQLYLALRLATLERYADADRTMPLILDDIAMTFDDGRTRALFTVLDAMADRFQVVLFTHHAHLGDLARAALPQGRAHVHELPGFSAN
ncbi:AAA family ATPase [Yinghuangia sp. YIM S09857]|uniref:ATP-binding protein n=1 Tax=Yinghuangia sp. YIM S09857 TaxID=3436929 RepID=UPI003F5326AB